MIENLPEGSGWYGAGAGLLAAAYVLRKFLTQWNMDGVADVRAGAEAEVLGNLRDEVKRLSDQNDKLAKRLNDMQDQAVTLGDQIMNLRLENSQLRNEIAALNSHNHRLQEEIVRLHSEITRLQGINGDDGK